MDFIKNVLVRVGLVTITASALPITATHLLDNSFLSFVMVCIVSLVSTCIVIFYFGINKNEKIFITNSVSKIVGKLR